MRKHRCRLLELLITHQNSSPHRDPGAAPVEKKKKGKRRNQELAVQEGGESDDTTSMSALNMVGEDSQDPLDNAVSGRKDWMSYMAISV